MRHTIRKTCLRHSLQRWVAAARGRPGVSRLQGRLLVVGLQAQARLQGAAARALAVPGARWCQGGSPASFQTRAWPAPRPLAAHSLRCVSRPAQVCLQWPQDRSNKITMQGASLSVCVCAVSGSYCCMQGSQRSSSPSCRSCPLLCLVARQHLGRHTAAVPGVHSVDRSAVMHRRAAGCGLQMALGDCQELHLQRC
jgi:hypothetical protein